MNYLRFTQYAYLLAGILFAVDAFVKWQGKENFTISAIFAAVCIFLFFFRRKFAKKFDDHNKKP
ncbi:hypothetical protein L1S35_05795 [Flavobacterium sp. AS60]|uniref:hypothetical protein n=1 Tax=Flavobacterium anseongense TaxID=2910677 RepID=UPI001F37D573|nr:hypothetical protein [Flavobacterium sp. AS60]MCF6129179.1 hypothetical protein [Flavobacterium sp. AS60]